MEQSKTAVKPYTFEPIPSYSRFFALIYFCWFNGHVRAKDYFTPERCDYCFWCFKRLSKVKEAK